MSLYRFLGAFALLFLTSVLVLLCYINYANLDRHRVQLERVVSNATGREFRIVGDIDVDLWPSVMLKAENVTLANAPWGSEAKMAEIGYFSTSVAPLSLIRGPILIEGFFLRDVTVLLESDSDGESNWQLSLPKPEPEKNDREPAQPMTGLPAMLRTASMENVRIVQRAAEGEDQLTHLSILALESTEDDRLDLVLEAQVIGQPLKLEGSISTRASLVEKGAGDISLNGFLAEVEVSITADIALQDSSITFETTLATLDRLGALVELSGLPAQPLVVTGGVKLADEGIRLHAITATTASAKATLNGLLAGGDQPTVLTVSAVGQSLADLMPDLPALGFEVSSSVNLAGENLTLDDIKIQVGRSDLAGKVALVSGDAMTLKADLKSELLDLNEFAGEEEAETTEEAAPQTAGTVPVADPNAPAAAVDEPTATKDQFVFKDEPLPLAELLNKDLDVQYSVATLLNDVLELNKLTLHSTLTDGDITTELAFDTATGGKASSRLDFITDANSAQLKAQVRAKDLRINFLGADVEDLMQIPATAITLDIQSTGVTPRELAERSNGKVLLTQGPGRMEIQLLGAFSSDVFAQLQSALNPFAEEGGQSNYECAIVSIDIEDGLSTIDPVIVQEQKVMVIAGGSVDLHTERLDLEFNTRPRSGIGV
ncbi:MAG: AsmA family protein, partial [Halioglobus sp.]